MASKLREDFLITGLFYKIDNYNFRKYLNIRRKNTKINVPDIMVIMMNPGSSRQEKDFQKIFDKEVPTIPDNTQDQIMRVMNNTNLNYARVLNLSDLRETKSTILIKKIEKLKKSKISHSIFDNNRKNDYNLYFKKNVPVICAWGVNPKLTELGKLAFDKVKKEKIIGLKKDTLENAYYHPLPQNYNKQKEWVVKISEIINSLNYNE